MFIFVKYYSTNNEYYYYKERHIFIYVYLYIIYKQIKKFRILNVLYGDFILYLYLRISIHTN